MSERLGIVAADVWSLRRDIEALLSGEVRRVQPGRPRGCAAIVGWSDGRGRASRLLARLHGCGFVGISEGPLRSVRPDGGPPVSLKADGRLGGDAPAARAAAGLAQLRRLRLSWRNDGRPDWPLPAGPAPATLRVVGGEDPAGPGDGTPRAVMADARRPAELATRAALRDPTLVPIVGVDPWAVFDRVERVEAPPGDLSDLAVLAGLPVAGRADVGAERVFADRFLREPAWFDPWSRRPSDFETVADQLAWLRDRFRDNARRSVAVGVSRWKQARIAAFLDGPAGPALFVPAPQTAAERARAEGGRVVVWETRTPRSLAAACRTAQVPLLRMEDGFLRSVGLGAAFLPGASCVLDGRGIYYDPTAPSDLEHILAHANFDDALLERARRLREDVVALRLSKYNVGRSDDALALATDRPCVLVPGQVEDDASVMLGSPAVPGNLALLRAARAGNPDAFIVFKPHPDVEAGLRKGRIAEDDALALADRVVGSVPIVDLLDRVDAVETMTSLAGFEALMRGRRTVVHGRPFYAGWGLTDDRDPLPRRTRRLTLDALVAGALILYPRYVDPVTGLRCPPEVLVRRLAEARDEAAARSPTRQAARAFYARSRHALFGPLAVALRRLRGAVREAPDAGTDRPA